MKKPILTILSLFLLTACTDDDASRRTLDDAGYTNIQLTGHKFFECGKDDTYSTGFKAKNFHGKSVDGTVCCGFWGKGCTIRH